MKKIVNGPIRNKEKTKRKLLQTVGSILQKEGHKSLNISNISRVSQLDKKLIYNYFGGLNGLIAAFLQENDFWTQQMDAFQNKINEEGLSPELVTEIITKQFDLFQQSSQMQNIFLWELNGKSQELDKILEDREQFGAAFFELADNHFTNSAVHFRTITAILVGAMYFLILHRKHHPTNPFGIDINTPKGKENLMSSIKMILNWTYQMADASSQPNAPS